MTAKLFLFFCDEFEFVVSEHFLVAPRDRVKNFFVRISVLLESGDFLVHKELIVTVVDLREAQGLRIG